MVKISHECPNSIFRNVQNLTAIDYCLVNLYVENETYRNNFKQAKSEGREIILDNAVFELGEAFDSFEYIKVIKELEPDWYIVPDALENKDRTIELMRKWTNDYEDQVPEHCKKIGVVQGKTYSELISCYDSMVNIADVDMVAISFDYSYYLRSFPHPNKYISWMLGRVELLSKMLRDGIIDTTRPHHLLGASLPLEGKFYTSFNWIYSTDTSNPVVHGLKEIKYEPNFGLYNKESQKLFTLINENVTEEQLELIEYNIGQFNEYWNTPKF